jgi:hypothetical protein
MFQANVNLMLKLEDQMEEPNQKMNYTILILFLVGAFVAFLIAGAVGK